MKKIIIIFSILLIFPSILFAGDAWLLWRNWLNEPYITDHWILLNALNTRKECLDALVEEHTFFYETYLKEPSVEVTPKPNKTELHCFQSFESEAESVSGSCKALLTHFVMKLTNGKGVTSTLKLHSTDDETIIQMQKEGKTKEEIDEYIKKSDKKQLFSTSKIEFWCLPAGVDPKTIK